MVAVGWDDALCLVVFKRVRKARMRFATILHVDNADLFARCQSAFQNYLLLRLGIVAFKIDSRFVPKPTFPSYRVRNSAVRLFYSRSLRASDVSALYSELALLP